MTKKDTLLISLFRDKNTKYVPHFLIRADGRTHQTKEKSKQKTTPHRFKVSFLIIYIHHPLLA